MIRSSQLQRIAEVVMVLGIIFLCQPWVEFLHRYGLTVIIVGLLTFMSVSYTHLDVYKRQHQHDLRRLPGGSPRQRETALLQSNLITV